MTDPAAELTLLRELAGQIEELHRQLSIGDPRRWRQIEALLAAWHVHTGPPSPAATETVEQRLHRRRWEVLGLLEEAVEGFRSGRLGIPSGPLFEWMRTAATLTQAVTGRAWGAAD